MWVEQEGFYMDISPRVTDMNIFFHKLFTLCILSFR